MKGERGNIMDNYKQMSMFDDDGEIILPCYEIEANNDECMLLENGCVYTIFYNDQQWATSIINKLNTENAVFRNCFMPMGVDVNFTSLVIHRVNDFGEVFLERQYSDELEVADYYALDYKNLKEKLLRKYNRIINNGNIPLSVAVVDVHDVRHLVLLKEIAQDYNIPVIAGMSLSKDMNIFINECIEMEVSIVESIYGGMWSQDKMFRKIGNAFNISDAVILQVDQCPVLLTL